MDSVSIEIYDFAFRSGIDLGATILPGVAVIAVLVITAKLARGL